VAGFPRQVLPLDIALTAPGIRGHFALQPDVCASTAGPPRRGQQTWLRHWQLVIGKRSPEYQALRRAGKIDTGT